MRPGRSGFCSYNHKENRKKNHRGHREVHGENRSLFDLSCREMQGKNCALFNFTSFNSSGQRAGPSN